MDQQHVGIALLAHLKRFTAAYRHDFHHVSGGFLKCREERIQ